MEKHIIAACIALTLAFAWIPQAIAETASESGSPEPTKTERADDSGKNRFEKEREGRGLSDSLKALRDQQKEQFKNEMDAMKLQMDAKRQEFKNKLTVLKDERKKEVLVKLDARVASISSSRVERMQEALDKLNGMLDMINDKAAAEKQNGKDTTAVDSAVASAEAALASASAAVTAQAGKTYNLSVTDDTTAKQTVGPVIKQMQMDLIQTHKTVIAAKKAVMTAAKELKKLQRGKNIGTTPGVTTAVTVTITVAPTQTATPTATVIPTAGPTITTTP